MSSIVGFVQRGWHIVSPPVTPKKENALKFGILGAANIVPMGLIWPAKTHPDVIIQCVAARDRKKAEVYAKKQGIPEVKGSYQDVVDDPTIDCIYVPLPNGLHYEWALKALKAGKHVLLEKPSVSNALEAAALFTFLSPSPTLSPTTKTPLVLLEAFHYRFQPQWNLFLSLLSPPSGIKSVEATLSVPPGSFGKGDIRFEYALAGGAIMDVGTYCISALREVLGRPEERSGGQDAGQGTGQEGETVKGMIEGRVCEESQLTPVGGDAEGADKVDKKFYVRWRFPGDKTGEARGSLGTVWGDTGLPCVKVTHLPVVVAGSGKGKQKLGEGEELVRVRTVSIWNFVVSAIWHRIDIVDAYVVRKKGTAEGEVARKWEEKREVKAYTWKEVSAVLAKEHARKQGQELGKDRVEEEGEEGEEKYWTSYRHQLGEFVKRVRGGVDGEVAGVEVGKRRKWIDGKDSVVQMEMIDEAYEQGGMGRRVGKEGEVV